MNMHHVVLITMALLVIVHPFKHKKYFGLSRGIESLTGLHLLSSSSSSSSSVSASYGEPSIDLKKAIAIIKEKVLISDIIGEYVTLNSGGSHGQYQCKCPFHKDGNPSMGINDNLGAFNCFSCGARGDCIQFVKDMENFSFADAVKKIVAMADLTSETCAYVPRSPAEMRYIAQRQQLEKVMQKASDFYFNRIAHDSKAGVARRYLISRKIRPETAFKFNIGYAPASVSGGVGSLFGNLTAEGYPLVDLINAGLVIDKDAASSMDNTYDNKQQQQPLPASNKHGSIYDRFRDRLMIPIRNQQGLVIGFGGRLLNEDTDIIQSPNTANKLPKYLNSPETMLFKKGSTLFGLDVARKAIATDKTVVFVEGYFDVISLHDIGIENAVGVLGTAITHDHLEVASKVTKDGIIVLLMDSDDAGQLSVERCITQILSESSTLGLIDVRVASFVDEEGQLIIKDASELCAKISNRSQANAAMTSIISKAIGWKQWMAERIIRRGAKALVPTDGTPSLIDACSALRSDTATLSRVIRSLSTFIASFKEGTDRTVIGFYCAELLSGSNEILSLQLQSDLMQTISIQADRLSRSTASSASASSGGNRPMVPRTVSSTNAASSYSNGFSNSNRSDKAPIFIQSRLVEQPKQELVLAEEANPPRVDAVATDSSTANTHVKVREIRVQNTAVAASDEFEFDIDATTIVPFAKTQRRSLYMAANADVLWDHRLAEASRSSPSSGNGVMLDGRVKEAEAVIIALYCHAPAFREEVLRGVNELTAEDSESAAFMIDSHNKLWDCMTALHNSNRTVDDVVQLLSPAVAKDVASILQQGESIRNKDRLSIKYDMKQAVSVLLSVKIRSRMSALLQQHCNSNHVDSIAGELLEKVSRERMKMEIEMEAVPLGDMYTAEMTKGRFSKHMGNSIELQHQQQLMDQSSASDRLDDVELLFWEDESERETDEDGDAVVDDGAPPTAATSGHNKYIFDVDAEDILPEGAVSVEEKALQAVYRGESATSGAVEGAKKVEGVTFGLDDIYDDEPSTYRKKANSNYNSDYKSGNGYGSVPRRGSDSEAMKEKSKPQGVTSWNRPPTTTTTTTTGSAVTGKSIFSGSLEPARRGGRAVAAATTPMIPLEDSIEIINNDN